MAGGSQSTRLEKEILQRAKVLGQVDKKFIACVARSTDDDEIPDPCGNENISLLIVDQHAADERVRVERFQRDFCTGFLNSKTEQRELRPPKAVLLTAREARQITSSKAILETMKRWGFTLCTEHTTSTNAVVHPNPDYLQVLVDGVPELLADKVSLTS